MNNENEYNVEKPDVTFGNSDSLDSDDDDTDADPRPESWRINEAFVGVYRELRTLKEILTGKRRHAVMRIMDFLVVCVLFQNNQKK